MHNRLKVRTSAEMQAINKKKEQEKAMVYSSLMKELLAKRNSECYDPVMSLCSELLHMNPDVSTVWNIRKEFLLKFKINVPEERKSVVNEELKLTLVALRINPKSYCAWYHRCWVLEQFGSEEEWTSELDICTKYLTMDERNFHTWNYRKYVVERLNIQLEKELDFSFNKLCANFSNYSAWHYRSKLIPRIYPVFEQRNYFESDIYKEEISLFENAVFTDPNDQSAWFYYSWLLSRTSNPIRILQAGFDRDSSLAWVVIYPFNPYIQVKGSSNETWEHLNGNKFSNIFIKKIQLDEHSSEFIKLYNKKDEEVDSLTLTRNTNETRIFNLNAVLPEKVETILQTQLKSCDELIKIEMNSKYVENKSKWPLLAKAILLEKLGNISEEEKVLEELQVANKFRKSYHLDLASRCKMFTILSSVINYTESFVCSCSNLTAFYYNFCCTLFKEIDLSKNPLGNNVIRKLDALLSCEVLNLSGCGISSIDGFPTLPKLRVLDLSDNNIIYDELPEGLLKCSKLEVLHINNNRLSSPFL